MQPGHEGVRSGEELGPFGQADRVHEVAIEFVEGNIGVQRTLLDYIEERVSGDPEPVGPMSA